MNTELKKIEFEKTKIASVSTKDTEDLVIGFEDGTEIRFGSHHDQECCESVYADFGIFGYISDTLVGKSVDTLLVKGVEDMGFLLCFGIKNYYKETEYHDKVFVACYNSQNGYYSDELELKITQGDTVTKIDLAGYKENQESY